MVGAVDAVEVSLPEDRGDEVVQHVSVFTDDLRLPVPDFEQQTPLLGLTGRNEDTAADHDGRGDRAIGR